MTKPDMSGSFTSKNMVSLLLAAMIAMLSWWMTVTWDKVEAQEKAASCLTPRTEWASRNVYVDNKLEKIEKQISDGFQIQRDLRERDKFEAKADNAQLNANIMKILEKMK